MSDGTFSARIRWQSEIDPCIELETRHPGFSTAEEAALYANGFSEDAALELRLDGGCLTLSLADGTLVELDSDSVSVWELPDDGQEIQVADDSDFRLVRQTAADFTARGLDGSFVQLRYGVLCADQAVVDVAVDVDETGLPEVTVHEGGNDPDEPASFSLGIIVRG